MAEIDTSSDRSGAMATRPGDPDAEARVNTAAEVENFEFTAARTSVPQLTRSGRVRKWDRPPPPHDWRWYVGNLGKVLIAAGLLMFAFVGYQLYGTGIETAAAQNELENEFETLLADAPPIEAPLFDGAEPTTDTTQPPEATTEIEPESGGDAEAAESEPADAPVFVPSEPPPPEAVVPVEDQNLPSLENGEALARLEIPRIGVDDIVVAGVETNDLKKGPGHFPDTPLPGQLGNAAIAGHRTTYGQPFRNVDKLVAGDEIRVTTLNGVYVYRVTGQQIVSPAEYQVVATTDPTRANLTLTSCHPVFTARERIVIFSELAYTESAPVGEPVLNYGEPLAPESTGDAEPTVDQSGTAESGTAESGTAESGTSEPVTSEPGAESAESSGQTTGSLTEDTSSGIEQLGTEEVNEGIADAFSEGWFSDPGANAQVGLWGSVLAIVALGAYFVSRRLRRDWAGLAIGLIPFTVTLYFFFQNVNRLLPPNL